jgi:hypothetical protein
MLPILAPLLPVVLAVGVAQKPPTPVTAPASPAPSVAAPSAAASDVLGRVPNTRLFLRLDVPGFTKDDRTAKILQQALGLRGVIIGAIPDQLALLQVIVDKETDKHITDAEWRDLNLEGGGGSWKYFETGGLSCGETTVMMEGSGSHDYHGFTVRGGHRIDLSLSESLSDKHAPNVPRELFDRLVKSFRLGLVRLGTWNQMPAAALDFMDAAFKRTDDWKNWFDEQQKAKPEDYAVPFAKAEVLRFYESKPEEQIPAYARAIEILAAKKDCTAADRLAHAASEDGMALAFLEKSEASEVEKALPHLESALKIAGNLTAPVRAAIQYDQARVHARLGHAEIAIDLIKKSESEDPGAIDHARVDKEFEAMRKSAPLQELFRGDRGNR